MREPSDWHFFRAFLIFNCLFFGLGVKRLDLAFSLNNRFSINTLTTLMQHARCFFLSDSLHVLNLSNRPRREDGRSFVHSASFSFFFFLLN